MKIQSFSDYNKNELIAQQFFDSFDSLIKESGQVNYESIKDKIFGDLKLNANLSLTFGTGINALYPIVDSLIRNMKIASIELNPDKVVLLTICAFTIIYLEEKKCKTSQEEDVLRKDSKSMLEELKMSGIGNGIVKKITNSFRLLKDIFNVVYRNIGKVVVGFIDMFSYVAILIPIMNGILFIIGKYELNIDTLLHNFTGLIIGIGTVITKRGIGYIIDKLKNSKIDKREVLDGIDTTLTPMINLASGEEMITEQ